jgi:hypothetical protein
MPKQTSTEEAVKQESLSEREEAGKEEREEKDEHTETPDESGSFC